MDFSIQAAARQHPHRVALVSPQGTWTFAAVARASARLARRISKQQQEIDAGNSPSQDAHPPVALLGETRVSTLIALYALFELEIPIVLIHPRWTPRERLRGLRQSGASLYLTACSHSSGTSFASENEAVDGPSPSFDVLDAEGQSLSPLKDEGEALSMLPATASTALLPAGSMAVVFTSGTTAEPKAAVLSRRAFLASARASQANLGWQRDDRWLLSLPVAHVGGLSVVTRCLAGRRTVVLDPSSHFEPKTFGETLSKYRVTLASLVPTMLHRLLLEEPPWQPPSSLRALLLGGAAASSALLEQAAARQVPVLTTYGLTETCSQVTTEAFSSSLHNREAAGSGTKSRVNCGKALEGFQVRIRSGLIQVKGDCLMTGYLPLHGSPQPFTEDGWLNTGDGGWLAPDGTLQVLGRQGDLIITGGENVHPQEVEVVLREHPNLADACVFGIEDPVWGQRVAAALVAGPGEPSEDSDLADFCQQRLASFKIPRALAYVPQIPLQPNGKVSRRLVAAQLQDQLRDLPLG